ncbi:MAG TPA: type 4a pilus biogenesis protein PilO [Candidatus Binatia bacterium]|nr:type 4a pilus biogenesis protein PilO [Candidatus Binatia bacterium]
MNDLLERFFGLTPQMRVVSYVGGALLLGLVYWNFFYSPMATTLQERNGRLQELEAQHAKKTRMVAQLEALRKEVKELDAKLKEAIAQLPDQKEIPDLLSTVSSLGRESGLEILIFRQRPEVLEDFYAEVPVEMLMKGTYAQLSEFFDRVGRLNRIVNVKDISMKTPVVNEGRVILSTSCIAVTFRFLSEEERARIAAERARKEK